MATNDNGRWISAAAFDVRMEETRAVRHNLEVEAGAAGGPAKTRQARVSILVRSQSAKERATTLPTKWHDDCDPESLEFAAYLKLCL